MRQFITLKEDIVAEAVDGVVSASGGRLARLDGYPHIRVVLRADWDKSRVALVSGGSLGHEPAHAGVVGAGIPTAAICSDVFASPSVDAVLAGILAMTGPAGCLPIIKNDTGVRLNFGLDVAMVVVDGRHRPAQPATGARCGGHTLREQDRGGAGRERRRPHRAAKAGRSSYVNADQLKGQVDPGAEAVARSFESLAAWAQDGTGDAPALRSGCAT
ncbi:dihydroxyacetone kinase [Citreicella sp. SE45]|nr:dihydroxyacetone kinase [Citreicella sp. SE45]